MRKPGQVTTNPLIYKAADFGRAQECAGIVRLFNVSPIGLLALQVIRWVSVCGAHGFSTDYKNGNQQNKNTRRCKQPPAQRDVMGKVAKPTIYCIVGNGHRKDK